MSEVADIKPLAGPPLPEAVETLRYWLHLRDLGRQRRAEYEEAQRRLALRAEETDECRR